MAFDGIIVSAMAGELSGLLTGGKIEKIYQPETGELVLHIHTKTANFKLFASVESSQARFHLLTGQMEYPQAPPAFCMLLRKHLSGGRITKIEQYDSERVLEIHIDTVSELGTRAGKALIFEIMGKHSNIVLIDAVSRRITDSIKRISPAESRVRQVLPGYGYEYPPSQNKIPFINLEEKDALALCRDGNDTGKDLLGGIQGISPAIAERLAASENIYAEIVSMREALCLCSFKPVIYTDGAGAPLDFHIFPLPELESSCEKLEFDNLSKCLEYYYTSKGGLNRMRQKTADLEKAVRARVDKLYLKKQRISEDILAAENTDVYRLYGELLTANIHLLAAGSGEAKLVNYYDGQEILIPLDKRFSPAKNAQNYFKRYAKSKTEVKEKTLRLAETNSDISYLESVQTFIENASAAEEIEAIKAELTAEGFIRKRKNQKKQQTPKPAPYKYRTSNGLKVMAGRNNTENDVLTFKTAARTDVWLHTKDIPGAHVILFADGGVPSEADILEAASVAAFHSKGRASSNVPVDYVPVKYVKKPSGAKPGMVIFTNNKTVYVNPKLPLGYI